MSHAATLEARTAPPAVEPDRRTYLMLALASVGFAVNFWAWALLSLDPPPRFLMGLDDA